MRTSVGSLFGAFRAIKENERFLYRMSDTAHKQRNHFREWLHKVSPKCDKHPPITDEEFEKINAQYEKLWAQQYYNTQETEERKRKREKWKKFNILAEQIIQKMELAKKERTSIPPLQQNDTVPTVQTSGENSSEVSK